MGLESATIYGVRAAISTMDGETIALGLSLPGAPVAFVVTGAWELAAVWAALGGCVALAGCAFALWRRVSLLERKAARVVEQIRLDQELTAQHCMELAAELQNLKTEWETHQQAWHSHLQEWGDLQQRFSLVELQAGTCVPARPPASGMNINKHVEVSRLAAEGWQEFEIAEELAIPVGEVRLLLHLEQGQLAPRPARQRKRKLVSNGVNN
jgi:hypothetical protein